MDKGIIHTDKAPAASGPYSQAVKAGGFLFVSGQIPLDPNTGHLVMGDMQHQTLRVMKNIEAILHAAGCSLDSVVRATIYMKDIHDYTVINEVYSQFFKTAPPARAAVEVSHLPKEARVEIEVVAVAPEAPSASRASE